MTNKHLFGERGSLLVQLLVSLGVIVLLLSVSLPFFRQYQPNLKLKAEAKKLVSNLRYAQQLTITEQKIHYLEMDIIGANYKIIKEEAPLTPIEIINLDRDINFQQINGLSDNRVIFNSYGGVSEAGNIVLINSNGQSTTIVVKPSGYIQWNN